jgi:signal transduction histidine kinase
MQKSNIEQGLLRVFRFFALLRIGLAALMFFISQYIPRAQERIPESITSDIGTAAIFTLITMFLLLGYLSWPSLEYKLGRFYLPLALAFATAGIIVEQYYFAPVLSFRSLWEPIPFLYILLIIVAWQYTFGWVAFYTIATLLFEIIIIMIAPQPIVTEVPYDLLTRFSYAGMINRTIAFLVLGYVITWLMKAQRLQRQTLSEANQKLVRHAATLEHLTISRERVRISRELHDTLAHTLSALAVQIEAVLTVWESIPEKAQQMLEQMHATMLSGLDETRRSLSELRSSPLEDMGLALSVCTLAEDFATRYSLSLQLDIPDNIDDLPPEVELTFYRIAQEALENVGRHASARKLTLKVTQNTKGLTLIVADDGLGFDMDSPSEDGEYQFGLDGMYERAELISGDLTVDSHPGKGTTIKLVWENER